jgi:predicted aldo/keto reductase-like oxidoreductase
VPDNSKHTKRREFLKKGFAGAAGMAFLPAFLEDDAKAETSGAKKKSKIITRTLGKTGIELPVVSMGVMNADNPNLVEAALESGIVHLDTAHYYQRGRNEEMVGKVLEGRPRDSFVIATKALGHTADRHAGGLAKAETTKSYMEKFEISLKRLGLDYVDILYYHNVKSKEDAVLEHILTALQKLKEAGKIRYIGISTHQNEPEVIQAAVGSKVYEVVLTAYNFRMRHKAQVKEAIANAAKAGLGVVAMKTQAGVYWDKEREKQINMKAALKWALQDENVHTSIPGFTTFDQLNEDLLVMEDLALTPKEEKDLQLGMKTGMNGLYCQQCGSCVSQCREHLNIPTVMRGYMYAYGYKNLSAAKEAFRSARVSDSACDGCGTCNIDCTMGFDIKSKIEDIARIENVPDDFL